LVRQAAVGLHHAHENSLVHRDIKPSNLMLTTGPSGPQVKLLDLGLALLCVEQSAVNGITGSNQMMGTADYMAPEQVGDSHTIDIRADVYSLGCTLYKLITGHTPFCGSQYGSSLQKMVGHLRDSIPPVTNHRRDVPTALVLVLDRMLAKRPDDRFATPAEVVAAIAPFCMGHSLKRLTVSTRDPATDLRSRVPCKLDDTPSRRPPRRLFIASAAAASLLILAGIIVTIKDRDGHTVAKYILQDGDSVTIESEKI